MTTQQQTYNLATDFRQEQATIYATLQPRLYCTARQVICDTPNTMLLFLDCTAQLEEIERIQESNRTDTWKDEQLQVLVLVATTSHVNDG